MSQMTPEPRLISLSTGQVQRLESFGRYDLAFHQWSAAEIQAVNLAYAARRPLLVRGEPGTGKTQLARAAAQELGWLLHSVTIHARFDPQDLVYRFDAVRRLADAQAGADIAGAAQMKYWEPGPLWQAFDWQSSIEYGSAKKVPSTPIGHVILIDEIDKADSDVPNSLLEILGQRSISVAPLGIDIGGPNLQQPLIVITSNEDRELPAPFVRRCMVLNLQPDRGVSYRDWLVRRAEAHFGVAAGGGTVLLADDVINDAADQLVADRDRAKAAGVYPPGPAEYLDLLAAIVRLAGADLSQQRQLLAELNRYAFVKHHDEGANADSFSQSRDNLVDAAPGSSE
jgi:MoxR-like ATPase